MNKTEKVHKYNGEEFLVKEISADACNLAITYGENTVTVRLCTDQYGTGFRVFFQDGRWKGGWTDPSHALNEACAELLTMANAKTKDEWCEELKGFFDSLP